jgi:hypothetical protein
VANGQNIGKALGSIIGIWAGTADFMRTKKTLARVAKLTWKSGCLPMYGTSTSKQISITIDLLIKSKKLSHNPAHTLPTPPLFPQLFNAASFIQSIRNGMLC